MVTTILTLFKFNFNHGEKVVIDSGYKQGGKSISMIFIEHLAKMAHIDVLLTIFLPLSGQENRN